MIELATETVVSLARGNRHLPTRRNEKRVHPSTLYRWAKGGVRADDGTTVVLETIRVGRTLCTSVQAIQRFCNRLSARPSPGARPTHSDPIVRDDQRDERRAEERGF